MLAAGCTLNKTTANNLHIETRDNNVWWPPNKTFHIQPIIWQNASQSEPLEAGLGSNRERPT